MSDMIDDIMIEQWALRQLGVSKRERKVRLDAQLDAAFNELKARMEVHEALREGERLTYPKE